MATGDKAWFYDRAWGKLPKGWFPDGHPIVGAIVGALANAGAYAYSLIANVSDQARIKTSSGIFLELAAQDHLGPGNFPRRTGETDDSYSSRIVAERFRPLATRTAMHDVLNDLVGSAPAIFEPATDGTSNASFFCDDPGSLMGSYELPWACFIDCPRPLGPGVPASYAFGDEMFDGDFVAGEAMLESTIQDAEIERAVLKTLPAGVKGYLRIGALSVASGAQIVNGMLDFGHSEVGTLWTLV